MSTARLILATRMNAGEFGRVSFCVRNARKVVNTKKHAFGEGFALLIFKR